MLVTEEGISTVVKEEQFLKAPSPILVTDDGISTVANDVPLSKTLFAIDSTEDGTTTSSKFDVNATKALFLLSIKNGPSLMKH